MLQLPGKTDAMAFISVSDHSPPESQAVHRPYTRRWDVTTACLSAAAATVGRAAESLAELLTKLSYSSKIIETCYSSRGNMRDDKTDNVQ